jgi:hypothetical protein
MHKGYTQIYVSHVSVITPIKKFINKNHSPYYYDY